MLKTLLTTTLATAIVTVGIAQKQNKEELERQRRQLQAEISELNKDLGSIKGEKKTTTLTLGVVQNKISKRESLIKNISGELNIIEDDIYLTNREVSRLRRDLDSLRSDYAKSIVYAYKSKSTYSFLNFLFDANGFADAFKRYQYLKSFRAYRQMQAETIEKTQRQLKDKIVVLDQKSENKKQTLTVQQTELGSLEEDKKKKDAVLKELKSKEAQITTQIRTREAQRKKLTGEIAKIIKRELEEAKRIAKLRAEEERKRRKAEEDAAKKAAKANNNNTTSVKDPVVVTNPKPDKPKRQVSELDVTPEGAIVSERFENNKGRLAWPVSNGNICSRYGTHKIEGTGIIETNDGISICTSVGNGVKAVFEGEVSGVTDLGGEFAIIIKHGRYFTAYSHLASASVSKGQKVSVGQVLGKAAQDDETGGGRVDFMVSSERGFSNPEGWLSR
jgi:murein hydrolase activator